MQITKMVSVEEATAFFTNQIAIIVTIILAFVTGWRWWRTENAKHINRLELKLLGPDKDARADGIIFDILQEAKDYTDSVKKDMLYEYTQAQNKLLLSYQSTTSEIKYMRKDLNRMEKSLERITGGRYTMAKSAISDEEDNNGGGEVIFP